MSVRATVDTLGCSWGCVNDTVTARCLELLEEDPHRLDGVIRIGVDEHVWRYTSRGDRYVTVIVALAPRKDGRPARLLDVVEGRSEKTLSRWLSDQSEGFRRGVEVVAMDAFAGWKRSVRNVIPQAVEVLDPFHVVRLAGDRLDECRRRLQLEKTGRRGTKTDPLYRARRTLLKAEATLNEKQRGRLDRLFADPANAPLRIMWGAWQKTIRCYACQDHAKARSMMDEPVDAINAMPRQSSVPRELRHLGRTLGKRRSDVLAYFRYDFSSNRPTEAINGRLEHLRGIALGFRNITNYIQQSLLHVGSLRQHVQDQIMNLAHT